MSMTVVKSSQVSERSKGAMRAFFGMPMTTVQPVSEERANVAMTGVPSSVVVSAMMHSLSELELGKRTKSYGDADASAGAASAGGSASWRLQVEGESLPGLGNRESFPDSLHQAFDVVADLLVEVLRRAGERGDARVLARRLLDVAVAAARAGVRHPRDARVPSEDARTGPCRSAAAAARPAVSTRSWRAS